MNKYDNKFDDVVCGGGFKGVMHALLMAKSGRKICLVESSNRLGGVLNSIPWRRYELDLGCHLFDNGSDQFTKLMFEIHKDFKPVEVRYASVIGDARVTDGIAVPDLTQVGLNQDEIFRSLDLAINHRSDVVVSDYEEYLTDRYGFYVSKEVVQCARKKVGIEPKLLCSSAAPSLYLERVKCLPTLRSSALKQQQSGFDERIAVSSSAAPMTYYPDAQSYLNHRNYYPTQGGMGAFCRSMERFLEALGITVLLEDRVEGISPECIHLTSGREIVANDRVLWTGDNGILQKLLFRDDAISALTYHVAAVLVYFEVQAKSVSDITYIHDYRLSTPSFRISTFGVYGDQIFDGVTVICAEIFTNPTAKEWLIDEQNIDDVWAQVRELGIVADTKPLATKVVKTSKAFGLPLIGYAQEFCRFRESAKTTYPNIFFDSGFGFSKQAIYEGALQLSEMPIKR